MTRYTYKVIPAPAKGRKAPGVKGAEARFAHGLEEAMNEMAAQGWEYLRADILPSEERNGLTSTHTVYRSVLVFRRAAEMAEAEPPAAPTAPARPVRATPPLTAAGQSGDDAAEEAPEPAAGPIESGRGTPHLREVRAETDNTDETGETDIAETGDTRPQEDDGEDSGPRRDG